MWELCKAVVGGFVRTVTKMGPKTILTISRAAGRRRPVKTFMRCRNAPITKMRSLPVFGLCVGLALGWGCAPSRDEVSDKVYAAQEQYHQGRTFLRARKFARALLAFQKAADLEPQNPEHHILLGATFMLLGDMEAAESMFLPILDNRRQLDPHLRRVLLCELAYVFAEQGKSDEALELIREAVEQWRDNTYVTYSAGHVFLRLRQGEEAANYLEQLPMIRDTDRSALAEAYLLEGRRDEAKSVLEVVAEKELPAVDVQLIPLLLQLGLLPDEEEGLNYLRQNSVIIPVQRAQQEPR
jgi:tetratricopeptide (TPR) repeat protein